MEILAAKTFRSYVSSLAGDLVDADLLWDWTCD